MKKYFLITAFLVSLLCQAKDNQTVACFDFGSCKVQKGSTHVTTASVYSDEKGFGIVPSGEISMNQNDSKTHFISSRKPFYFSVNLPEGHYKVILTLGGSPENSAIVVKAESRRLMLENIKTDRNETVQKTIIVDVRNPQINDSVKIKLKPRELVYKNWDNKLTLEFSGENPSVSSVEIQKADKLPTIFLAGNSTVTDQEYEPWASWGQMFPNFLKANVVVANYAESGETLLAFRREKRLQKLLSQMKKGDYLFMEFAHNDQKPGGNHVDAFTTYKEVLKDYIAEARKKGGIPVLVTSTNRRKFDENGKIVNTLENYPEAMRQLAKEENVMLIDLNAMSRDLYEAIGPENSVKAFVHYPANTFPGQNKPLADDTHFNPYGAYELAKCVVYSIVSNNYPMKKFVRADWKSFNPKVPDSLTEFHWYESPSYEIRKPDGN